MREFRVCVVAVVSFCNLIHFTDDVCARSEVNDRKEKEGDNKRAYSPASRVDRTFLLDTRAFTVRPLPPFLPSGIKYHEVVSY
jgi:hypothetical protein